MSLRQRLLIVLILPLIVIAVALGIWRVIETKRMTSDLYDRSLLSAALAISRDVSQTGGEALSQTTLRLITEASGSQIFYHVKGPDGSFVTGYATPPLANRDINKPKVHSDLLEDVTYFDGTYRGSAVRAVQLNERMDAGWVDGQSTISVWQELDARRAFAWGVVAQTIVVIGVLLGAVLSVTWFALSFAMRPLQDLGNAINKRSSDDLSPIQRPMPQEVQGLVRRLNTLFGQLDDALEAKHIFISNAAHQLRNPIAGLLSLAEAVARTARSEKMIERSNALVSASDHIRRIVNQLLSYEKAKDHKALASASPYDLTELAKEVADRVAPALLSRGYDVEFQAGPVLEMLCEPIMIQEGLQNLIENSASHGQKDALQISVSTAHENGTYIIRVKDNGIGLSPDDQEKAFARFSQLRPSEGSGLGLSITEMICSAHGGTLVIENSVKGASISMRFKESCSSDFQA